MQNRQEPMPSSASLEAFEAAARLGSFTRAAKEMRMTQAAVSYAVKNLEGIIGAPLFLRDHRQIRLTEIGQRFFTDVSVGLSHIRQSIKTARNHQASRQVTLSVSTALASFWLLPRLADFRYRFPEIDLRVQTTDRDIDIQSEGISLGVRYGSGILPHYERQLLAPEIIYPVCSKDYLAGIMAKGGSISVDAIAQATFIHLEEPFRPCPTWRELGTALGMKFPPAHGGLCMNDYTLVIQAVLEGQGLAIGWHHLLGRLVDTGALVRPVREYWNTGVEFCIVWAGELGPDDLTVRDWLAEMGRLTPRIA